jgi:hypothetical protein
MIITFLILLITLLFINYFFQKNKILIDKSVNFQDSHKKFINHKNNNIPLSGGFFFFNFFKLFIVIYGLNIIFFIFFNLFSWNVI